MKLRNRLAKLERVVEGLPPPGQLSLIVVVSVGSGMAEGRPSGVFFNVDGAVATVVFDGPGVDASVRGKLEKRLAPWGKTIVCHPGEIAPPADSIPV